jgi:uncharacterized protein YutE (UPF0331/DUF86 family)
VEAVNEQLLQEKADVVVRCLGRVKTKAPTSLSALTTDLDAQDIIVLNLERAIQACVDMASHIIAYTSLPPAPTMAESFICLRQAGVITQPVCDRMVKATGLRNLLVHEYQRIDWGIVWQVITKHLNDPHDFSREVLTWHGKRGLQKP